MEASFEEEADFHTNHFSKGFTFGLFYNSDWYLRVFSKFKNGPCHAHHTIHPQADAIMAYIEMFWGGL